MTESYGYYTYGDIKLKTLQGKTSWGFEKTPRTINVVSKNANSYKTEIAKNYDTSNLVLSVSKNALCNGISLVKSANSHFNSTDMTTETKDYGYDILDTKNVQVSTTDIGFYEITTTGQIARYNLTIIPTPSESIVKINNVEQSSCNGYETEEISYEISCDGYATKNDSLILLQNTNLEVELLLKVTLTINVNQEDAIIYINGIETNTLSVGQGEIVNYEVICDGYQTISETIVMNEDIVLNLEMDADVRNYNTKSIGVRTTWILKKDNSLWGTGRNNYSQQGDGTTTNVTTFTKRLDDVKFVRNNYYSYFALAVKNDNSLWGCGYNIYGYLGNGSTSNITTFTKLMDGDVKEVFTSYYNNYVLKNDNSLWCSGYGNEGQLGNGSTSNVTTFTKIMDDVKTVNAYSGGVIVIKKDNSLWGTGKNTEGQLGNGSTSNVVTFTKIMDDVKSVSCGNYFILVIKKDNSLWGCGDNAHGQLGIGTTTGVTTFTKITDDVKMVYCGAYHSFVIKKDNSLWGCGYNNYGQLGIGTTSDITTFTKIMDDVKLIDTGMQYGYCSWILKKDNSLWGCGRNNYGQQGNGNTTDVLTFTKRADNVKDFQSSAYTTWYIDQNDNLYGCGYNTNGQLGNGSTSNIKTFTKIMENVRW